MEFGKIEIKGSEYTVPMPVVDAVKQVLTKKKRNNVLKLDADVGESDVNLSSEDLEGQKKLKPGRKTPFDWQGEEGIKENEKAEKKDKNSSAEKAAKKAILNSLGIL